MTEYADDSKGGIDDLITWLNDQRRSNPIAPLVDLLGEKNMDRNAVLDLACIDLMHQHRNGYPTYAEQYVQDFPQLDRTSDLLDLIDAELCVAAELREPIDLADYSKRFPDLSEDIEELAQLDLLPEMPCLHRQARSGGFRFDLSKAPHLDSSDLKLDHPENISSDFSFDPLHSPGDGASLANRKLAIEKIREDYPLTIPEWFLVDQCISRDSDHCLLRGRDDVRGISLAMKIIRVPHLMADEHVNELLDVCEAAARVQNPHWIAPQMAAVQRGYLGVIRPWQFASPWQPASLGESLPQGDSKEVVTKALYADALNGSRCSETIVLQRWRQLATVAFAVEAAHRSGATHGALHAGNLAVDHQGNVRVFDATCSTVALKRWFGKHPECVHSPGIQSLEQRIDVDVQDIMKLVRDTSAWIPSLACESLLDQVHRCVADQGDSCLMRIGEILLQHADCHQPVDRNTVTGQRPRWRTRIARWWSRAK